MQRKTLEKDFGKDLAIAEETGAFSCEARRSRQRRRRSRPTSPFNLFKRDTGMKLAYQKYVRTYEKAERPGRLAMSKQTKNISRAILQKKNLPARVNK